MGRREASIAHASSRSTWRPHLRFTSGSPSYKARLTNPVACSQPNPKNRLKNLPRGPPLKPVREPLAHPNAIDKTVTTATKTTKSESPVRILDPSVRCLRPSSLSAYAASSIPSSTTQGVANRVGRQSSPQLLDRMTRLQQRFEGFVHHLKFDLA